MPLLPSLLRSVLPVSTSEEAEPLRFAGGLAGALVPFVLFLSGVAWLVVAGTPDERGFWPILLAALALGLFLAQDRSAYVETLIQGMSQPIVAIMVLAWLLAGVLAAVMQASGLVGSLVWLAEVTGLAGGGFVAAAFLICCAVSTTTGTSIGTLILLVPLLYPTGGVLGADPAVLLGALVGGASFGDNVSPVSDTAIASAMTQRADMGGVVKSRLRYALPAAAVALVLYSLLGGAPAGAGAMPVGEAAGRALGPAGLVMLAAPALVVALLLAGRHLFQGLFAGVVGAVGVGLATGLLQPRQLFYLDGEGLGARGLLVDGLERGVGISIFTLLLMGLAAGLEASGLLSRLVSFAARRARSPRGAEAWIFGATGAAVLLTTHSVVAILTVGRATRRLGERFGLHPYRRANVVDITGSTLPFLLPYFLPTILAASLTAGAAGVPRLSPLTAGLFNFHSWALLVVLLVALATGFGRLQEAPELEVEEPDPPAAAPVESD